MVRENNDVLTTADRNPGEQGNALLLRADADGIATLTLNRADKFNALSVDLLQALLAGINEVGADPDVRVVILAATGKAFCTGHDLKEMLADRREESIRDLFRLCSDVMLAIARIRQPVIAKVQGVATAAGCQLVATCDLAVASDAARFAVSGVNLGLFCATPMVALTRNLSRKHAMDLLMTGRFIDAAVAEEWGLINQAVPPDQLDEATLRLAGTIAAKSPAAVALGKRLFYAQLEAGIEQAYALASETMVCNMLTCDAQAGIDAFVRKQPTPEWTGR